MAIEEIKSTTQVLPDPRVLECKALYPGANVMSYNIVATTEGKVYDGNLGLFYISEIRLTESTG